LYYVITVYSVYGEINNDDDDDDDVDCLQSMKAFSTLPRNCTEHFEMGHTENGVYPISTNTTIRPIYCFMTNTPWLSSVYVQFYITYRVFQKVAP